MKRDMTDHFMDAAKDISVFSCNVDAQILINEGLRFLSGFAGAEAFTADVAAKEYSINATIHRGYYHPSPVYDLIVGNTRRGRRCKDPRGRQVTHCHYYNRAEELIRTDFFYQDKVSYTEWMENHEDGVYGFTVDREGRLSAVCRACYEAGKIVSYTLIHVVAQGETCRCFQYLREWYQYDAEGLCYCRFVYFVPESQCLTHKVYVFTKKDGYLVSYAECADDDDEDRPSYRITKRRKA